MNRSTKLQIKWIKQANCWIELTRIPTLLSCPLVARALPRTRDELRAGGQRFHARYTGDSKEGWELINLFFLPNIIRTLKPAWS